MTTSVRVAVLVLIFSLPAQLLAGGATATEPVTPPLLAPVTFVDTFDNNQLTGWTHVDQGKIQAPSHWYASRRTAHQDHGIYGGATSRSTIGKPGTVLLAGAPDWTSYDLGVNVTTADNDGVGVTFRYQDENNFYRFSMDSQRHYRRLVKRVGGVYTRLAEVDAGYRPGSGTGYGSAPSGTTFWSSSTGGRSST